MRCTANHIRLTTWAGKVLGIPRRAGRPEVVALSTPARLVASQRQGVAMVGALRKPCSLMQISLTVMAVG